MTSPPSPPNRRRRKIVVAFAVLLLSWWYWPRGDARFVGKWKLVWVAGSTEALELAEFHQPTEETVGELWFNRNGTMDDRETFKSPCNYVQWSIEANALALHKRFHYLPDQVSDLIRRPYERWTGESINIGHDPHYDIDEITSDVITVHARHQPAERYQLRRIPE